MLTPIKTNGSSNISFRIREKKLIRYSAVYGKNVRRCWLGYVVPSDRCLAFMFLFRILLVLGSMSMLYVPFRTH